MSQVVTTGLGADHQPTEGTVCRLPRETLTPRSSKRVSA
jgi:hypothetical protein